MNLFLNTIAVLALSFAAISPSANAIGYNGMPGEKTTTRSQTSDMDLSAEARRSLESDPELSPKAQHVNVRVRNGRATVQGAVANENEKDIIRQKVLAIEGIHSVNDKLKVSE